MGAGVQAKTSQIVANFISGGGSGGLCHTEVRGKLEDFAAEISQGLHIFARKMLFFWPKSKFFCPKSTTCFSVSDYVLLISNFFITNFLEVYRINLYSLAKCT